MKSKEQYSAYLSQLLSAGLPEELARETAKRLCMGQATEATQSAWDLLTDCEQYADELEDDEDSHTQGGD